MKLQQAHVADTVPITKRGVRQGTNRRLRRFLNDWLRRGDRDNPPPNFIPM